MTERDDLRRSRERKLEELAELGLPLLPDRFGPVRPSAEILEDFEALKGTSVRVAGRLMRVRAMGKAAFAHILDASGEIQLYFKRDVTGEKQYEYFKLLDLGDLVGLDGNVFQTRTGEITIEVHSCVLLAKAYRPLPEKWHGLSDVETRYRQRYLDLISNPDTRHIFRVRHNVVRELRHYLDNRGFVEVETPTMQPIYGGAAARPFVSHYAALETDVFLRIATELYLKRLIVAGLERVYEIGKDFRNEGFSRKNSPEFTMLELYQAYVDYRDVMALTEDMFASVAQKVLGTLEVEYGGHAVDLTTPWRRLTIADAVQEYGGFRVDPELGAEQLRELAVARGVEVPPSASRGDIVDEIVSTLVEPNLIQPTFLIDYPVDFPGSLLAKRKRDNPALVDRFEAYAAGFELANGFTELNDPRDQLERMQQAVIAAGEEPRQIDWDYIVALEHGMPPTGGMGFGVDRYVMLLTGAHHIRETILFPLLRPRDEHAEP